MKKYISFILFLFQSISLYAQDPLMKIEFTMASSSGMYAPEHVLAVWVENNSGTLVNSQIVYGDEYKSYLIAWNATSMGYEFDAITGPTQTVYQTHIIMWDIKDWNQMLIQDGDYTVHFEMSENNSAGPHFFIEFTKGQQGFEIYPPDELTYKNISVIYYPNGSSVDEIDNSTNNFIFPNPVKGQAHFSFLLKSNEKVNINIYDLNGSLVKTVAENRYCSPGENEIVWDIDNNIPNGVYYYVFSTPSMLGYTEKIIITR